ncbi:hypothetical protein V6N13_116317 [Hibiscus sabdariffa]
MNHGIIRSIVRGRAISSHFRGILAWGGNINRFPYQISSRGRGRRATQASVRSRDWRRWVRVAWAETAGTSGTKAGAVARAESGGTEGPSEAESTISGASSSSSTMDRRPRVREAE